MEVNESTMSENRNLNVLRGGLVTMLLSGVAAVEAHDLWLEQEGGGCVVYQGHRHSAHAGAELVPYDPGIVKSAVCADAAGISRSLALSKSYPVRVGGDCAAIMVSLSSGYWTKTAWETKNVPKVQVSGVIRSWLSEESVKRVNRWISAQPLTDAFEIVAISDPSALKQGDKLTVMVTENKKPKAGVPVAYDGETRGATGDDGKVAIRVRHGGMQLIAASVEAPLNDGKADVRVRTTALQFELPK
jgi:nickel transport protein